MFTTLAAEERPFSYEEMYVSQPDYNGTTSFIMQRFIAACKRGKKTESGNTGTIEVFFNFSE
jgi:hypothetical protein